MTDAPPPPPPVGLGRLMGWGILGQIVYVVCQFVTLLALTRYASVEQVGLFGLATAVVVPVFFFFDLNMRINVASAPEGVHGFQDFRDLLALSAMAGLAVVAGIALLGLSGDALILVLILGVTKAAETLSNLCYGVFQRFDRMHVVARSLILRSLFGTAIFVLLLALGASVELAFLAQLAVWSVMALFVDHPGALRLWRAHGGREGRDGARMRALARESLPLAFNGLLSALQGFAPRYVIAGFLGVAALGQFTVVGYAMQAITTVAMAATQSMVARVRGFVETGRQGALRATLVRVLGGLAALTALGVGLSLLFGDWVVRALFGADYAGLGGLLALCVLAAGLRAMVLVLQMCLLAARRFGRNLAIRVGSASAMVLACALGALAGGLTGVALGMCAAFALHIAALALAVRPLGATPAP